jgi:methylthioribulose-1-phosphate dehydratase
MSESFTQIASGLVATAADFYARGWVLGTSGNLSAVVQRKPLHLAITPSGVDKGALQTSQILLIDDRGHLIGNQSAKPSDECPLHLRIAGERGAGAVLHTHSVWSTMLSNLYFEDDGMAIEGYEMLKGLQGVKTHQHREWLPIFENSQNMLELADRVSDNLRDHPEQHGFLLRRHGLYTWGDDLAQAKRHVEIFEFLLEALGRTHLSPAIH